RRLLTAWRGRRVVGFYQLRSPASVPCCPVARRALLRIDGRTFLGGSSAWWQFLPGGTDSDIPGTEFFCRWRLSHTIGGRLGPRKLAHPQDYNDHHKQQKSRQAHCAPSHRQPPATVVWYCRYPSAPNPSGPMVAHCGHGNSPEGGPRIARVGLGSLEPGPGRPHLVTGAHTLVLPASRSAYTGPP